MEQVAGLVLAGGRSSRMGRDKALLEVGGEPLVCRQLRLLREAGVGRLFVSVRLGDESGVGRRVEGSAVVLPDRVDDAGPIEGFCRAVEEIREGLMVVLAVDLPGIDAGWVRALIGRATPEVGVVPRTPDSLEPLFAVYPVARVREWIRAGSGGVSPRRLAEAGLVSGWMREWGVGGEVASALRSWNRPGDWGGG